MRLVTINFQVLDSWLPWFLSSLLSNAKTNERQGLFEPRHNI